ncbi:MAG: transposase [Arsenophonus sp. NEOnobi-MAG3]
MSKVSVKYPAVMKKLEKDQEELLAFYDFPLEQSTGRKIRTTNLIESAFTTGSYEADARKTLVREKQTFQCYLTATVCLESWNWVMELLTC